MAALLVAVLVGAAVVLLLPSDDESALPDSDVQVAEGFEDYCAEVVDRRDEIGEAVAAGPTTGLIRALPSFRALAEKAPDDIRDEWAVVISRVEELAEAFEKAGADPATYDREDPPDDVSPEDRQAIEAAAVRLGSRETSEALAGVDQQARDVCKTPLSL